MPDESYYKSLLLEGRAKLLRELASLASSDRPPGEAKQYAAQAEKILRDLIVLDEKLAAEPDSPNGLDYREDDEINVPIVRYLSHIGRPASESEITRELIRGRFRGYRDEHKMGIRVGRCIRSYTVGKPSENPKLKVSKGLVGLPDWPDNMFA